MDDFGDRLTGRRIFTHEDGTTDRLKFDHVRHYKPLEIDVYAIGRKFHEYKQNEREEEKHRRCQGKRKRTELDKDELENELKNERGEHRKTKRTGRISSAEVPDYKCV